MKKILFILCALLAVVACTSQEDNLGNTDGQENNNDSFQEIDRSLYAENIVYGIGSTYGFSYENSKILYDSKGKYNYYNDGITFNDFDINPEEYLKEKQLADLQDIKGRKCMSNFYTYLGKITFKYSSNGFIQEIRDAGSGEKSEDGPWAPSPIYYKFENDGTNYTKVTRTQDQDIESYFLEYTNLRNSANLDLNVYSLGLYYIMAGNQLEILLAQGFAGRRSKYLLSKVKVRYNRQGVVEKDFDKSYEYTTDSLGRISIIKRNDPTNKYGDWYLHYGKEEYTIKDLSKDKYVDLGLSVKWASCNLGADEATSIGTLYNQEEVDFYNKEYNASIEGGKIPTETQWRELGTECESYWACINNVSGLIYIGKNGNKIFIPANRKGSTKWMDGIHEKVWGYYATSSYVKSYPNESMRYVEFVGSNQVDKAPYGDIGYDYSTKWLSEKMSIRTIQK